MRADSEKAWAAFQSRLAELGAQLIEPEYLGTKVRHRAVCSAGHPVAPRPEDVNRGIGICRTCAGKDQHSAWMQFRDLVAKSGGTVLEPGPLGVNTPHRIRCAQGHEVLATPSYVRIGGGVCVTCSPVSRVRAEQGFRDLVTASGGVVLENAWLGTKTPHRVVCSEGHETTPLPGEARRTGSICRICAGHDSATSWRLFRARVRELGGTVVEIEWLGNKTPHRVICAVGHEGAVRPNNVGQGSGICRTCAGKAWDAFYVVTSSTQERAKFGVTSGDLRRRLRAHQRNGYDEAVRTIETIDDAHELETAVLATLRLAAIKPVHGREYYNLDALPVILDIVDHWPTVSGRRG